MTRFNLLETRVRVYVSGPLTSSGDPAENVQKAIAAGRALVGMGYAPLVPHLWHFGDPAEDLGYEAWLEVDCAWVVAAEAVLRLPGESKGADREVEYAQAHGIPVYHSVEDLRRAIPASHEERLERMRSVGRLPGTGGWPDDFFARARRGD